MERGDGSTDQERPLAFRGQPLGTLRTFLNRTNPRFQPRDSEGQDDETQRPKDCPSDKRHREPRYDSGPQLAAQATYHDGAEAAPNCGTQPDKGDKNERELGCRFLRVDRTHYFAQGVASSAVAEPASCEPVGK